MCACVRVYVYVCPSLKASFFQLRDQRTMHSCKLGHVLFATEKKESVTATRARAERKKKRERERARERERVRDNGQDCELRRQTAAAAAAAAAAAVAMAKTTTSRRESLNAKIMARKNYL